VKDYRKAIRRLVRHVFVWPHPEHLERVTFKVNLINRLDTIAREVTHSHRPKTMALVRNQAIPEGTVLKRTNSDTCNHVIMPDQTEKRNWAFLIQNDCPEGAVWLSQTLAPILLAYGEWRVFVLGGQPVFTLHTVKKAGKIAWGFRAVETFCTLQELK
jgi:hypothetical protein